MYARFWYGARRWRPGVIVSVAGPLSYDVQIGEEVHRRHASQLFHHRGAVDPTEEERLRREFVLEMPKPEPTTASPLRETPESPKQPVRELNAAPAPVPTMPPNEAATSIPPKVVKLPDSAPPPPPPTARPPSTRVIRKPRRFDVEFSGMGSSNKN